MILLKRLIKQCVCEIMTTNTEMQLWKEVNQLDIESILHRLFATLLVSNQLYLSNFVWNITWKYLSDDVIHREKLVLHFECNLILN